MKMFNIIKPDMINDDESIDYYLNFMNLNGITFNNSYYLNNWIETSKLIYEIDNNSNLSDQEKITKRKKTLVTIMGYNLFYKNMPAIINIFDLNPTQQNVLNKMALFKKELRAKYVINTDKYYLKILNESEIDFSQPLQCIDIDRIQTQLILVPFNEEFSQPHYDMVFFNKIHVPDPNISIIRKEFDIINCNNVFDNKTLVRSLKR